MPISLGMVKDAGLLLILYGSVTKSTKRKCPYGVRKGSAYTNSIQL